MRKQTSPSRGSPLLRGLPAGRPVLLVAGLAQIVPGAPTAGPAQIAPGLAPAGPARIAPGLATAGPAPAAPETAVVSLAQDAPVLLRLEGRRGDVATYRFEQQIDLRMPPEFGGDQRVSSELVVEQRVERVDETAIRYVAEVEHVSVEMAENSMVGGELDFSRFEGQRFRMTMSRRGELLDLEPVGEAVAGTIQLEQSMRQVGFPVLPDQAVRPGDRWVDTTRMNATAMALPAEGDIVSVSRTTLKRLVTTGAGDVAELVVETSFRFEPDPRAIPGMRVEVEGERQEEVRFDVTRGRFLGSEGTQRFEMTMAIPGASGVLSIQGTARSRAELVP